MFEKKNLIGFYFVSWCLYDIKVASEHTFWLSQIKISGVPAPRKRMQPAKVRAPCKEKKRPENVISIIRVVREEEAPVAIPTTIENTVGWIRFVSNIRSMHKRDARQKR